MANSRKKFLCLKCKVDTLKIGEHYFLKKEIWNKVNNNTHEGMLCISCVETLLNRTLNKEDFVDCHLHNSKLHYLSDTLKNRLGLIP